LVSSSNSIIIAQVESKIKIKGIIPIEIKHKRLTNSLIPQSFIIKNGSDIINTTATIAFDE